MSVPFPPFYSDANGVRWSSTRRYQPAELEAPDLPWFRRADLRRSVPGQFRAPDSSADADNRIYDPGTWFLNDAGKYGFAADAFNSYQWAYSSDDSQYIPNDPADFSPDAGGVFLPIARPIFGDTNWVLSGSAEWQADQPPDRFVLGVKTADKNRSEFPYFLVGEYYVPYVYEPRQRFWDTNSDGLTDFIVKFVIPAASMAFAAGAGSVWGIARPVASTVTGDLTGSPYASILLNAGANTIKALLPIMPVFDSFSTDFTSFADAPAGDVFESGFPFDPNETFDPVSVDVIPFDSGFSDAVPFEAGFPFDPNAAFDPVSVGVVPYEDVFQLSNESLNEALGITSFSDAADAVVPAASVLQNIDSSFNWLADTATQQSSSFDLVKLVAGLAQTYLNYRLRAMQIGASSPAARTPSPGITKTLPDGSTLRTNADGSTTVRRVDGSGYLIRPDGTVVPAQAGSLQAPGVGAFLAQNTGLLMVGAAGVGLLLMIAKGRSK